MMFRKAETCSVGRTVGGAADGASAGVGWDWARARELSDGRAGGCAATGWGSTTCGAATTGTGTTGIGTTGAGAAGGAG